MHKCKDKELTQINVGNLLLSVACRLFIEMIPAGGFALIEHPADAGPNFASIFKLPITQRLLALPVVRKETFPQGLLGQVSPKPTSILTLRMPGFSKLYAALKTAHMPPALPQLDELHHAFFMREVISNFKTMLIDFEYLDAPVVSDLIPHGIALSKIPVDILPLLEQNSTEQTHGADYHGPLPSPS